MHKIDKILIGTFILSLAVLGTLALREHSKLQDIASVQAVCDKAHSEISGTSEQACGDIQDRTGTEYICGQFRCWVELR